MSEDNDYLCAVTFIVAKDGSVDVRTTWSSEDPHSILLLSRLILALHSGNLKDIHMHIMQKSIEHIDDAETVQFLNQVIKVIMQDQGENYHKDPIMKPSQTFVQRRVG